MSGRVVHPRPTRQGKTNAWSRKVTEKYTQMKKSHPGYTLRMAMKALKKK